MYSEDDRCARRAANRWNPFPPASAAAEADSVRHTNRHMAPPAHWLRWHQCFHAVCESSLHTYAYLHTPLHRRAAAHNRSGIPELWFSSRFPGYSRDPLPAIRCLMHRQPRWWCFLPSHTSINQPVNRWGCFCAPYHPSNHNGKDAADLPQYRQSEPAYAETDALISAYRQWSGDPAAFP